MQIYCKVYSSGCMTRAKSVGIYLFNVNHQNTGTMCEICSKLSMTPEQLHWRRSDFFIVNFEQISRIALVFSLLTLNKQISAEKIFLTMWRFEDQMYEIKLFSIGKFRSCCNTQILKFHWLSEKVQLISAESV